MPTVQATENERSSRSIEALRRSHAPDAVDRSAAIESAEHERNAVREVRLDRIEAGKTKRWRTDLRITQGFNGALMLASIGFVAWRQWAMWAALVSATAAASLMWLFARKMRPREERLRRLLVTLARHRRLCAGCGYRLTGLSEGRCPECGLAFDPHDNRHLLEQQTLHVFSGRARQVSAVVTVFVVLWTTALVGGQPWVMHAGLGVALLIAFVVLHASWTLAARRAETGDTRQAARACSSCGAGITTGDSILPRSCQQCGDAYTFGDLFVRPDVRRLADRRVLAIQVRSLLSRWVFLFAVCGGLTILVQADVLLRLLFQIAPRGLPSTAVISIPVIAYLVTCGWIYRRVARAQQGRLKLLFQSVVPQCRRCRTDISSVAAGGDCSQCGRAIALVDIVG